MEVLNALQPTSDPRSKHASSQAKVYSAQPLGMVFAPVSDVPGV